MCLYLHSNGFPFSDPVSYALVRHGRSGDSDHFIVRARWHSSKDYPKNPLEEVQFAIRNADPTVTIQVAECENVWANQMLAVFETFNIPMHPKHPLGVDGVIYQLALPHFFCGVRLQWWSNGPDAWKPVIAHVGEMLNQIESDKFVFQDGTLAFAYSVELVLQPPGIQPQHLAAIRTIMPRLREQSVAQLLAEIKGTTRLNVGFFKKNEAIIKCKLAEESRADGRDEKEVRGLSMSNVIYFDNAATSWPKPPQVAQRMTEFLNLEAANPGRAGHRMAVGAEKMIDGVRKQLTDFVGGTDHHRMVFTMNATDALNIAMKGLIRQGDHIITTTLEHNSVSRPLQAMADSGFITLTRIDFSPGNRRRRSGGYRKGHHAQDAPDCHDARIPMFWAQCQPPTDEIGKIARAHNVRFLVDGAQTLGTVPIHVQQQEYRYSCVSAPQVHSSAPPAPAAFTSTPPSRSAISIPSAEGGTGGDSSTPTQPKLFPYFLEGGTPNTVGIAGLGAAVEFVVAHDPAKTLAQEQGMVQRIIDVLLANPKFTLYGPKTAANRVGTVSFNVAGYTPQEAGSILDESFSIAVRPGLHCSPYAHKGIGTFPDGAIRISPGHFNTEAELVTLLDALEQLAA